jgi:DNA-binding Lrp family transcriptional regulator
VITSIDLIDRRILAALQSNGQLSNVDLAKQVGLTPPSCLRRVQHLKRAGFIRGYRALLNSALLGYTVTAFAAVQLASQAAAKLQEFDAVISQMPLVRECWTLSGEFDFLLKCVAPDLDTFWELVHKLTSIPNVRNVRSSITLGNPKSCPDVPIEPLAPLASIDERERRWKGRRQAAQMMTAWLGSEDISTSQDCRCSKDP